MDMLHIPETHKTLKSMERYLRALRNEYDTKMKASIKDGTDVYEYVYYVSETTIVRREDILYDGYVMDINHAPTSFIPQVPR